MRISTISLLGMKFHSNHGCLESERREGNLFEVDFEGKIDISAASSDRLEDTLDYCRIYEIVASRMVQPSNLLEKVALDLEDSISEKFPCMEEFTIRIRKACPPVGSDVKWAEVSVKHIKE
ncbi:MAG: dihydroneopterin aldolase [Bacteroidales bacterium]|nr:dihydroneopterin aldolase [Bacteroidales bacterium]